jgi:hypothetical protein
LAGCPATNRAAHEQGRSTIVSRLVNTCWSLFKVAVAVALVGGIGTGVYMYVRMDDEIRRRVESFLAERYPQFEVSVGGARLVEGKGIAVYDLSLALPGGARNDDPLLAVDELMLVCDVELTKLVQGSLTVHRVEVKHPQLSLERGAAGRWNIEALLPLKPCGGALPQVVVHGGTIAINDAARASQQPLSITSVDLSITPVEQASVAGQWPSMRVEGQATGPLVKRAEFTATLEGKARLCSGTLSIHQLQVAEAAAAWIEPMLPPEARTTRVTGTLDGAASVSWKCDGTSRPAFTATLALNGGRVEDPRLSRPITELTGKVNVDSQQLKLENIHGKWGNAAAAISLNRTGWAAGAPIAISARATDAMLDEALYQALITAAHPQNAPGIAVADQLRKEWDAFSPTGVVDATLQATFKDAKWKPTAALTGRQLTFQSEKFAYRVTDGDGTLTYHPSENGQPSRVDVDMHGIGGGQRLHIVAQVIDPKPAAAGWAQITGENLELDERLIAAIDQRIAASSKEPLKPVIASLHPSGKFNLAYWRIDRPQPGVEPRTSLRVDLTDVRINYDDFPYPLRQIRGVIESHDNQWTFSNFESGGRQTVLGEGYLRPGPQGHELWLKFTGQNVPLDDNLFYALQVQGNPGLSPAQFAWKQLRPSGGVNLVAQVRHRFGQGKPNIAVQIQPTANSSLRPEFFAYLLDDVTGTISYNDGDVLLQDVKAHHDGAAMGANGAGSFAADRGWQFKLSGLWADRIALRSDLMNALPPRLSKLIEQLRPSGTFSLHNGELTFQQTPVTPLRTSWDIQLEGHQADINCGLELHNIHGSIRLRGEADDQRSHSSGELALETITYQDVQVTNVNGPIWVDESQCLLGKWATAKTGEPERRVSGGVYGGSISGNGWVQFGTLPQYSLEANLVSADLSRLIIERFGGRQAFQGKMDAKIVAQGDGPSLARLVGEGTVHIREANIYELPILIGLLKTIRTGDPNKTAFNESNIAFRIKGKNITLDKVDFLGDVVDLYGYGETDFDQNLKMIFRSEVFLRDYHVPFLKNLVGQASQNSWQMTVDGTLSNPHVTSEAFPGFKQLLQQMKADLENPAGAVAARQANRGNALAAPANR